MGTPASTMHSPAFGDLFKLHKEPQPCSLAPKTILDFTNAFLKDLVTEKDGDGSELQPTGELSPDVEAKQQRQGGGSQSLVVMIHGSPPQTRGLAQLHHRRKWIASLEGQGGRQRHVWGDWKSGDRIVAMFTLHPLGLDVHRKQ